jgi:hypothetical protein
MGKNRRNGGDDAFSWDKIMPEAQKSAGEV